jgi:hypothetical protein
MSGLEVEVVDHVVEVTPGFAPGPAGPTGHGVPVGGTAGQVLAKATGADHDTVWADPGEPAGTVATHAAAADPHGDRAFATAADATHAAAADAHPLTGVAGLTAALALLAPLASPALSGTPTAPTAAGGTANTQLATTAFVASAIAALINSSPGALDTLAELAAALGDDPNFATTITNALAGKLAKSSNLSDLTDVAAAVTNLGAGAVGALVFGGATASAIRTLLELTVLATTPPATGVATFLAAPSSANLAAAITDETGSGALVFASSPTLVTPALGTPSALVLTNATGLPSSGMPTLVYIAPDAANAHTLDDADAGKCVRFTNAGANSIVFPATLTQGTGGWIERAPGAGAITWSVTGDMVVTPSAASTGHTGSAAAPSYIWWECDEPDSVIVGGDTA